MATLFASATLESASLADSSPTLPQSWATGLVVIRFRSARVRAAKSEKVGDQDGVFVADFFLAQFCAGALILLHLFNPAMVSR